MKTIPTSELIEGGYPVYGANGNLEDKAVLTKEPFRSVGSITTLFKDDLATAAKIMDVASEIKRNSEESA